MLLGPTQFLTETLWQRLSNDNLKDLHVQGCLKWDSLSLSTTHQFS